MTKDLFQHINQFVKVEEEEFIEMISYFEHEVFRKKDLVMQLGEHHPKEYFVVAGCLHMYFIDPQGIEHTVQFGLPKWWIADYLALQRKQPAEFYIQAVENTQLYSITATKREKLLAAFPKMESYFRTVYQIAYGAFQTRMKYILSYSKEDIYLQFKDAFPDFVNSVPQYLIASYLGLSAEYVSKLRRKITS
ncbi:Crp/Fnr family transcriptional regulator [Sphingobacterium paucimobilis]|uniref:Cyclic nucleotide-binding domain-containing protein n=1 Tax=Sphingobacterium paucimobilis HER1398 TaxID=1346330 RepID=U2IXQ1_9SPHI|nr:Crp/Fnr family transcriptional regulator [Sphingobacterium paucimobilis]ERJ57479.1 hypothetical protein M472_01740 [Sphingobacterium paucimobilis HER1398]